MFSSLYIKLPGSPFLKIGCATDAGPGKKGVSKAFSKQEWGQFSWMTHHYIYILFKVWRQLADYSEGKFNSNLSIDLQSTGAS